MELMNLGCTHVEGLLVTLFWKHILRCFLAVNYWLGGVGRREKKIKEVKGKITEQNNCMW